MKRGVQAAAVLDGNAWWTWRILQAVSWLLGFLILLALVFYPRLGIAAFWNVLIPVAPALFVVAAGVWRNICPLAGVALLPHHLNFSRKKRLPLAGQGQFQLLSAVLLFLVVPLRHLLLDTSGQATATVLIILALVAFVAGLRYEWKSGWCAGLCPVSSVEKLYGQRVAYTPANAHCTLCKNCTMPCPDSTPGAHPLLQQKTRCHRLAGLLLVGGLPGFIWGWFHVPDYTGSLTWEEVGWAFGLPYLGLAASLFAFLVLRRSLAERRHELLVSLFAASAIICYYWYRLPALIGFGLFRADGRLVDLSGSLPAWTPWVLQSAALLFFGWWIVLRRPVERGWLVRPPYKV